MIFVVAISHLAKSLEKFVIIFPSRDNPQINPRNFEGED